MHAEEAEEDGFRDETDAMSVVDEGDEGEEEEEEEEEDDDEGGVQLEPPEPVSP